MILTPEQKKDYIDSAGVRCPVCRNYDISGEQHSLQDELILVFCHCNNCKAYWTDTYALIDVNLDD